MVQVLLQVLALDVTLQDQDGGQEFQGEDRGPHARVNPTGFRPGQETGQEGGVQDGQRAGKGKGDGG